jgi:hypothetical protein
LKDIYLEKLKYFTEKKQVAYSLSDLMVATENCEAFVNISNASVEVINGNSMLYPCSQFTAFVRILQDWK